MPVTNPFARQVVRLTLGARLAEIEKRSSRYREITDHDAIRAFQLAAFNQTWQAACARYRFYRDWRDRGRLPAEIGALDELRHFPVLRKADLQPRLDQIMADAAPCGSTSTGGSTGQPTRFPRTEADADLLHASQYVGRAWWGMRPGDRQVILWGHSHLFGDGLKGKIAVARRRAKDWLIGIQRLSAYRLGEAELDHYREVIARSPGAVLYAYVSAARRLANHVQQRGDGRIAGKLKLVILTAETIAEGDAAMIGGIFGCPVANEYGLAEAGTVAYGDPAGDGLRVLWDSHHVQAGAGGEALISSLRPLRFPLIKYGTGDMVEADPTLDGDGAGGLLRLRRVIGRMNDLVDLPLAGGRAVTTHSSVLTQTIKHAPEVRSFEARQRGRKLTIAVLIDEPAALPRVRARAITELRREFADLDTDALIFELLERETLTLAGKHRFIVREAA